MSNRVGFAIKRVVTQNKTITVAVEGNIGSGKSTFLSNFVNKPWVEVVEEPVAKWQNCGGHNLLQLMYEDPHKWGFSFQSQVQLTMLQNHMQPHRRPVKMLERSVHSGRRCFIQNLHQSGVMCGEQAAVLDAWYKWLCERGSLHVDLFIYIRTSPQVAYERVVARARTEEKETVDLVLLQKLHDLHEDWLLDSSHVTPVLIVNGNQPLTAMPAEYQKCSDDLKRFLQEACCLPT